MQKLRKLKKVMYGIGVTIVMLPMKISSAKLVSECDGFNISVPERTRRVGFVEQMLEVFGIFTRFALIPLILLIGALIFYKKSKCKKSIKITILVLVGILVVFYLGYTIYNFL